MSLSDVKKTLEHRLSTLDEWVEHTHPSSRIFDELTGKYEECKLALRLVNDAEQEQAKD